jgi:hypothetical protein
MSASLSLKERLELWKLQKQQRQVLGLGAADPSHGHAPPQVAPTPSVGGSNPPKVQDALQAKEESKNKFSGSSMTWDRSIPRVSRRRISSTYRVHNAKVITSKDISDSSSECSKENESPSHSSRRKILAVVTDDGANKSMNTSLKDKEKDTMQIASLSGEISRLREENRELKDQSKLIVEQINEIQARNQMAMDEIGALNFLNAVQAMKIEELEDAISQERLIMNENASTKSKKHKTEIQKLTNEKAEYEQMANAMIAQLNSQMVQLQTMAMGRINVMSNINTCIVLLSFSTFSHYMIVQDLEKQLMEEQRKSAQLEQDARNVSSQRIAASPAVAVALVPQGARSAVAQRRLEVDRDSEEGDADEEEDGSDTEPEDDDS